MIPPISSIHRNELALAMDPPSMAEGDSMTPRSLSATRPERLLLASKPIRAYLFWAGLRMQR